MIRYPYGIVLVVLSAMGGVSGCSENSVPSPAKFAEDESAVPLREAESVGDSAPDTAAPVADAVDPPAPVKHDPLVAQTAQLEAMEEPAAPQATVPEVLLTEQHESLVHARVGDTLPAIELPKVGGGQAKLADLYGSAATVVAFWKGDRQMSQNELADLGPDVVEQFGARGVAVVGIAVEETASGARSALQKAKAGFPNLLDDKGQAFAKVGAERLPWTLVLDANGKIIWFDLEYSHATRRELRQALLATVQ